MKIWGVFGCALLWGCVGGPSAKAPNVAQAIDYPLYDYDQPNGLRVVVERAPDYGVSGVVLALGAGAADEAPGQAGLAHLVEHLVFHARPGGALDLTDTFTSLGVGAQNGMTDWDGTTYFAFAPTKSISELIGVFLTVLAEPLAGVTDADFRHELAIVQNEQRFRTENGTPGQAIGWLATSTLHDGHPYKHPVAGTQASLATFTLESAQKFAKAHYRASVATLVVSAPIDVLSMRTTIDRANTERLGTSPPARHESRLTGGVRAPPQGPLQIREAPVDSPTLWMGWPVPGGFTRDSDILKLLSKIGAYEFWSNVEEREGDIGSVASGGFQGLKGGLFFLELSLKQGRDPEATANAAARQMLHGLSQRVHQASWFEALKRSEATRLMYSEEDAIARSLNLAWSASFANDRLHGRRQSERIVALDADAVSTYYDRYLSQENARSVLVRPGADAALGGPGQAGVAEPPGKADAAPPPPEPALSRSWMRSLGLDEARVGRLKNGVEVVIVPKPGSPFHSVVLGFRGGAVEDTPPGARLAASWARGYSGYSPSVWGISYSGYNSDDVMSEVLRSTGSDVAFTLKQLDDVMAFPIPWPTPQFTSQLEVARSEETSPRGSLARRAKSALFGAHLYGASPTADEMRDVSASRVYGFVDAVRRPDNAVLVIVGAVDADSTLTEAEKTIGRWTLPANTPPISVRAPAPLTVTARGGAGLLVQQLAGTTLAQLSFSCVLPPVDDTRYAAAVMFDAIVQNALFDDLRERLGAAYYVDHRVSVLRGGTAIFEASTEVDYAELGPALDALRRLAERPFVQWVDVDRLNHARASVARSYNLSYATSVGLARRILEFWKNDWPIASLEKMPERMFAASIDDIARLAQHCQRNHVVTALGDEGRIRAAWGP